MNNVDFYKPDDVFFMECIPRGYYQEETNLHSMDSVLSLNH